MHISHRSTPIIECIEQKTLQGKMMVYEADRDLMYYKYNIELNWNQFAPRFNKSIKILSKSFSESFFSSLEKIWELDDIADTDDDSGTIIAGDTTICYFVTRDNKLVTIYEFYKNNLLFFHWTYPRLEDMSVSDGVTFVTKTLNPNDTGVNNREDVGHQMLRQKMCLLFFIKYCDTEVRHLPPNKKIKDFHCRYKNDTNSNIQILDSNWFTTLVQSNEFKVRGHFRLQPCGHGMKKKKLIWINDFKKNGYTRVFKRPLQYFDVN